MLKKDIFITCLLNSIRNMSDVSMMQPLKFSNNSHFHYDIILIEIIKTTNMKKTTYIRFINKTIFLNYFT